MDVDISRDNYDFNVKVASNNLNLRSEDIVSKNRSEIGKERVEDGNKEELNEIQRQIKKLVKKKTEIKRRKDFETSSNNSLGSGENSLPQRMPRSRPRVVSNVRLFPPRPVVAYPERKVGELDRDRIEESNMDESTGITGSEDNRNWKRMDTRKRKVVRRPGRLDPKYQDQQMPSRKTRVGGQGPAGVARSKYVIPLRKLPKSAAIMIVGNKDDFSYAEALKGARSEISLEDLRIERIKIRKAANGGMLIEVLGPEGSQKADMPWQSSFGLCSKTTRKLLDLSPEMKSDW